MNNSSFTGAIIGTIDCWRAARQPQTLRRHHTCDHITCDVCVAVVYVCTVFVVVTTTKGDWRGDTREARKPFSPALFPCCFITLSVVPCYLTCKVNSCILKSLNERGELSVSVYVCVCVCHPWSLPAADYLSIRGSDGEERTRFHSLLNDYYSGVTAALTTERIHDVYGQCGCQRYCLTCGASHVCSSTVRGVYTTHRMLL